MKVLCRFFYKIGLKGIARKCDRYEFMRLCLLDFSTNLAKLGNAFESTTKFFEKVGERCEEHDQ